MSDVFKFPYGYEVTVCRKEDIIECLDENIIDKEVALAIITQCEVDATNFLKEGRWTSIPYLGNMRVPKHKQKFKEIGGSELLKTAEEELDKNRYVVFRRELNADIGKHVERERLYRYMTSQFVTKHRHTYKYLLKDNRAGKLEDKEVFARFMCYSYIDLTNYIPID